MICVDRYHQVFLYDQLKMDNKVLALSLQLLCLFRTTPFRIVSQTCCHESLFQWMRAQWYLHVMMVKKNTETRSPLYQSPHPVFWARDLWLPLIPSLSPHSHWPEPIFQPVTCITYIYIYLYIIYIFIIIYFYCNVITEHSGYETDILVPGQQLTVLKLCAVLYTSQLFEIGTRDTY